VNEFVVQRDTFFPLNPKAEAFFFLFDRTSDFDYNFPSLPSQPLRLSSCAITKATQDSMKFFVLSQR
jgi:hypothetical protein